VSPGRPLIRVCSFFLFTEGHTQWYYFGVNGARPNVAYKGLTLLFFVFIAEGHTQWYYFGVNGARPNVAYKFNLINMQKSHSLYEAGLRPLLYSEKKASREGVGWHRAGGDVSYHANFYPRASRYGTVCFVVCLLGLCFFVSMNC